MTSITKGPLPVGEGSSLTQGFFQEPIESGVTCDVCRKGATFRVIVPDPSSGPMGWIRLLCDEHAKGPHRQICAEDFK